MTNYEEMIPEEVRNWIEQQAISNEMEETELFDKFLELEKELREVGLRKESEDEDEGLEDEEYYDMIMANLNAFIISVQGMPTKEFEVFVIGIYKPNSFNNKVTVDVVGLAVDPENLSDPEPIRITAWEDNVPKALTVNQFCCYKAKLGYNKEDKPKGCYVANVTKATDFNECDAFNWMNLGDQDSIKNRQKLVMNLYGKAIPLGKINEPKSQSKPAESANGKMYTDPTDLKVVRGNVIRVNEDPQGEWLTFSIVDKTFKAVGKQQSFTVWANPIKASELEIGEGSVVEFLGTVTRSKSNGQVSMAACTIMPKLKVAPTNVKNKIKTAINNEIESKPKKLSLSLTGEDED